MSVPAIDTTSTISQIPYQPIYPSLSQTQTLPPMMSDTNTKECLIARILKSTSFKVILAIIAIVIEMIFKYKVMKSLESLKSLYNVQSFRLVDKKEDEKKK